MSLFCVAEIDTHDPVGRYVTLYVYVDNHDRSAVYTPILQGSSEVPLSAVFRTGSSLPQVISEAEIHEKITEVESKLRYPHSKVRTLV